jgi:hypothetical protein
MDKVQQYRQRAGECRTMAAMAPNADIREHYLQLANVWDQLADERLAFFVQKEGRHDERRKKADESPSD